MYLSTPPVPPSARQVSPSLKLRRDRQEENDKKQAEGNDN